MKPCVICTGQFEPRRMGQKTCSPVCERERKRQIKIRKDRVERLKTRRDYINEAQRAFNAYIRFRDAGLSCICCDMPTGESVVGGAVDCGHYRSVGSAPHLRFDERNAHAQRKQCNRYGAGRAVDYRIGLIKRLGLSVVESLEADNEPRKWTIPELIAIRDLYRRKLKDLKDAASASTKPVYSFGTACLTSGQESTTRSDAFITGLVMNDLAKPPGAALCDRSA